MTPRQAQTLAFIKQYIATHGGVSPSLDEIKDHLGLAAKSGAHRIVSGLRRLGYITFTPKAVRSIELTGRNLHLRLARDIDLALDRYARHTRTSKAAAACELIRAGLGVA